jgi:hypothetical protein
MEQATTQKLTGSNIVGLLLYGAFQGALVAFAIVLWNHHDSGHWESHILGRFIINIVLFAVGTLATRKLFPSGVIGSPRTPMGARIQTTTFFALMLGLAFVLWKMF